MVKHGKIIGKKGTEIKSLKGLKGRVGRFGLDNGRDKPMFGQNLAGDGQTLLNRFGIVIGIDQNKMEDILQILGEGQTFKKVVIEFRKIKGGGKSFAVFVEHVLDGVDGAVEMVGRNEDDGPIVEFVSHDLGRIFLERNVFAEVFGQVVEQFPDLFDIFVLEIDEAAAGEDGKHGDDGVAESHAWLAGWVGAGINLIVIKIVFLGE